VWFVGEQVGSTVGPPWAASDFDERAPAMQRSNCGALGGFRLGRRGEPERSTERAVALGPAMIYVRCEGRDLRLGTGRQLTAVGAVVHGRRTIRHLRASRGREPLCRRTSHSSLASGR
jgi:hypothetical protein